MKLFFDGRQIVENVGVVEFEVVQYRRAGAVVHKLAALVEERGVVLVCFDHKVAGRAQARGHAEVQRHPADQKTRLQAGAFQNPCEHGGGGGFAMGASHCQNVPSLQHVFSQPLRPAHVGCAAVQNRFHQREFRRTVCQMGARNHVADHKHVGRAWQLGQLICPISLDQFNAERAQLVAHWRVHPGIATCHRVTSLSRQCRQSAHEGAANSQYVYVHGRHFRQGGVGLSSPKLVPCRFTQAHCDHSAS